MKRIPLLLFLLIPVFAQISIAREIHTDYRNQAAKVIADHSPEKIVKVDDTNYWKSLGAAYTISRNEASRDHSKTMVITSCFGNINVSFEQLPDTSYKTSFRFLDYEKPFFSITWPSLEDVLSSLTTRTTSYW